MTTRRDESRGPLVRVQGPALPVVKLVSESDPLTPTGELIRVSGPALPLVTLMSEPPVPPATVRLALPFTKERDGNHLFQMLHSVIEKANEMEAFNSRAGVRVDGARSGVRGGEVVLVVAPNDPDDAIETCKRVADYLFAAARATRGVTVQVFATDAPDAPVYELAG